MNRLIQKKQKARNFARAFLRTHVMEEAELFAGIDRLVACCREYPLAFHILELSSARIEEKYRNIEEISCRLTLPAPLVKLLKAVLRYKEFGALFYILHFLKAEFKKQHRIEDVVISSSHAFDEEQKKEFEALLAQKIAGTLRFFYKENKELIAGIRIESPSYYWEHSLARTIRTMRQRLPL